ncbi:hypothetical protein J056_002868 [Wallemia ichthyophaga EXF-994]|uniref:PRISE-like Rossmann-fold domain-containing protein n=1 Tax=Wallemia ichthyophaga (strain EXF-994 / CBS 113033) TaxID=1299270 RepID=R9A980_WALI9|nr:uncharacterized protein J056_002868 [Wallemia ichthyophaga EXF-994]EOQ98758.1 hypothetical protein J056_002868 [Wallemia ichthyophaga EXF-994]
MVGKTALVFGATGISGIAAIEALLNDSSYSRIIAISRRPVERECVEHIPIDLIHSTPAEIADALDAGGAGSSTHVFFYAYIDSKNTDEQNAVNNQLFERSIEGVSMACTRLSHFHLQTGYKYYMPAFTAEKFPPLPFREDAERQSHVRDFFYYYQEDKLKEVSERCGWKWSVSRPCAITGFSKGNWMSVAVTMALYIFACREFGEHLHFPGPLLCYSMDYDNSTASNNAEFQLHCAEHANNQAFNIHDGQPYQFNTLWPKVAGYFGMEVPSPPAEDLQVKEGEFLKVAFSVQNWANKHREDFPALVHKYNLDPHTFEYANWSSIEILAGLPFPTIASLEAARSIGWTKSIDTYADGYKEMHQLPKICIPPNTSFKEAYIDGNVLFLSKQQHIDLSMINHHHIITRCVDELFVLLYLHNERRLKLIQSFTKKSLNCRCILHIKTVSEDDAKWLLKKMMKWFHLSNVDYKRVCAYGMAGEYNNVLLSDQVDQTSKFSLESKSMSQVTCNASMSTLSLQSRSSISTIASVGSISTHSPTNIPYKRSKSDSTSQPRHPNLVCFSGQKSLHQERSIASLSDNVKPPFLRSISSPNQQELDRCRSVAL